MRLRNWLFGGLSMFSFGILPVVGGCIQDSTALLGLTAANANVESTVPVEVNRAPVASAGEDQTVASGEQVFLNGSGSSDADGDQMQFIWGQTGGTPGVTLQSGFSSAPRFFAPTVTATTTLTFRLTIGDGQAISTDDVAITITP